MHHRLLALAVVAALVTLGVPGVTPAAAAPADVGLQGPSHAGTGTPTGTKRSESVLWWNDGSWWGNLWDTVSDDFHIFRLDAGTQTWVDTGVTTETRAHTHSDTLWTGSTLLVASHLFVSDGLPSQAGFPSRLFRFTYNSATKTYVPSGPPTQVNDRKTETLTIDADSTGRVWATWMQDNRIFVNATAVDGRTWGTPFPLPSAPGVSVDDSSALVAFGPAGSRRIGVMWSSQAGVAPDGMYFSSHADTDPDATWSEASAATTGPKAGDDHINLKWLDSTTSGVYAAVKTSFTMATQPLIQLLVLDVATSKWTQHTIATVAECPNRVILLIDESRSLLRTFATFPKPSDPGVTNSAVCSTSGGAIYERTSPLNPAAISFGPAKTLRIMDADQYVHNVSSTKQNIKADMGLTVIADVNATSTYWFYSEPPNAAPDTTAPTVTSTSPVDGATSVPTLPGSVVATFSETVDPASVNGSTFTLRSADGTAVPASVTRTASAEATLTPVAALSAGTSYTATVSGVRDTAGNVMTAARSWSFSTAASPPPQTGPGITRQTVSTVTNTTAAGAVAIPQPAGTVAGDVLVSCLTLNGGSVASAGVPAGWTPIASVTGASNPKVFGYVKVASSSEPTTYTWSLSGPVRGGGGIARYAGASGLDGPPTTASGTSAASGALPAVTTTTANAMLVSCMGVNSTSVTLTSPGGLTQAFETGERRFELADGVQAAAGGSGTVTWAFSDAREWAGWLVALRPAP